MPPAQNAGAGAAGPDAAERRLFALQDTIRRQTATPVRILDPAKEHSDYNSRWRAEILQRVGTIERGHEALADVTTVLVAVAPAGFGEPPVETPAQFMMGRLRDLIYNSLHADSPAAKLIEGKPFAGGLVGGAQQAWATLEQHYYVAPPHLYVI